jgi:hypothetical protein
MVSESRLDTVLETFAVFVDLKSPCMAGHSRGVAALVAAAGHHVRHVYDKIGVASRAGAALFAVANDLLQWRERAMSACLLPQKLAPGGVRNVDKRS